MRKLLETPVAYCVIGVLLSVFPPIRADWWGLLVLGFLIGLYAFLAKGEKTAKRFTVGDNSYIIGFVYTLSIITLSLIFDAESLLGSGGRPGDLHPLLRTIGIALGTSVIGMICRFLLTHGIEVAEDAFDRAVGRTAVAAAKLEGAVTRLEPSTESIARAMGRTASAISAYAERVDAEAATAGESLALAAERMLERTERRVAASLDELSLATKSLSGRMAADLQGAVEPFRQALLEASRAIEEYASTIQSQTHSAGEALNRSVAAVIEDLGDKVAHTLDENVFDQFRAAVTELVAEQAAAVRQNAGVLATALDDLNKQMHAGVLAHGRAVADTGASLTGAVDDLKRQIDASVETAEEIRSLAASWRGMVDSHAWSVVDKAMQRFTANVEALHLNVEAIAEHQSKAVSGAQGHVERMREATRVSDKLMRELERDVDGIVDLKARYRNEFEEAATRALEETHRLYARLIGGAAVALSGLDDLDAFARNLRIIAERTGRDKAVMPSTEEAH